MNREWLERRNQWKRKFFEASEINLDGFVIKEDKLAMDGCGDPLRGREVE